MHIAGGSAGTESTCNAGDLGDPWAGKNPWRRNSLQMTWGIPWTVYSPWGHKDSYTTEWLSLSLWHMASGRLIEETKNDNNANLLGAWPSQSKMGLEGGRRHGMFTVRAQTLGGWGGKGATCEDACWYGDGPGEGPRGLWAEAEAMLGEVIQPVCCLSHRGGAEGDTPTQTCDNAVAGRFKQQSCDPEQSKPQRESGETVQTNKEPSGLRPSSEGPGVTDHREQVAGTTDSPGNPDFTILSTKIPLLSPKSSYP